MMWVDQRYYCLYFRKQYHRKQRNNHQILFRLKKPYEYEQTVCKSYLLAHHLKFIEDTNPLLKKIPLESQVWMSHGDTITEIPLNL